MREIPLPEEKDFPSQFPLENYKPLEQVVDLIEQWLENIYGN